jgi:hypothetical protein
VIRIKIVVLVKTLTAVNEEHKLEINSTPPGATVSLDGVVLGKTPLVQEFSLQEKEAKLSLTLAQFIIFESYISLRENVTLKTTLTPLPASQPTTQETQIIVEQKPIRATKGKKTKGEDLYIYPGK